LTHPSIRLLLAIPVAALVATAAIAATPGSAVAAEEPPISNELFTIDTARIDLQTPLGVPSHGTATLTAVADLELAFRAGDSLGEVIPSLTGTCPSLALGSTVRMKAGDTCTYGLDWTPTDVANVIAGWAVQATKVNPEGNLEGAPIDGRVSMNLSIEWLTISDVNFGPAPVGERLDGGIVITNPAAIDIPLLDVEIPVGAFALTPGVVLPQTIPAQGTLTIPTTFTPRGAGTQSARAALTIQAPFPDGPISATEYSTLSGRGIPAAAQPLQATNVDFGEVLPGATADTTMTVTNPNPSETFVSLTNTRELTDAGLEFDSTDYLLAGGESVTITVIWHAPPSESTKPTPFSATAYWEDLFGTAPGASANLVGEISAVESPGPENPDPENPTPAPATNATTALATTGTDSSVILSLGTILAALGTLTMVARAIRSRRAR